MLSDTETPGSSQVSPRNNRWTILMLPSRSETTSELPRSQITGGIESMTKLVIGVPGSRGEVKVDWARS